MSSSAPHITQLPEEVLNCIISQLPADSETLVRLRYTCMRFAYLSPILEGLFGRLLVRGDDVGLQRLRDIDTNGFIKYATSILFRTPPWDGQKGDSETRLASASRETESQAFMKARELLNGQELREVWERTFKQINRGVSVLVAGEICGCEQSEDSSIRALGDSLLTAAIATLSQAHVIITRIELTLPVSGEFEWATNTSLTALDLSSLHTLVFEPDVLQESYGSRVGVGQRTAGALSSIMQRCNFTLQELSWGSSCPMEWSSKHIIALSQLRVLILDNDINEIDTLGLAAWMREMPRLEEIRLSAYGANETLACQPICDAIRFHLLVNKPPRFQCTWVDHWISEHEVASLDEDLTNIDHLLLPDERSDTAAESKFPRALALYMTSHIDWSDVWDTYMS